MKLILKEIKALEWIAEQYPSEALSVAPYRDEGDVGWLRVAVIHITRSTRSSWVTIFKVSPLGHVYDQYNKVVREGPVIK